MPTSNLLVDVVMVNRASWRITGASSLLAQLVDQIVEGRKGRCDHREIGVEVGAVGPRPVPSNRLFEQLPCLTFFARGGGPHDERRSHVLVMSKRAVRCRR